MVLGESRSVEIEASDTRLLLCPPQQAKRFGTGSSTVTAGDFRVQMMTIRLRRCGFSHHSVAESVAGHRLAAVNRYLDRRYPGRRCVSGVLSRHRDPARNSRNEDEGHVMGPR